MQRARVQVEAVALDGKSKEYMPWSCHGVTYLLSNSIRSHSVFTPRSALPVHLLMPVYQPHVSVHCTLYTAPGPYIPPPPRLDAAAESQAPPDALREPYGCCQRPESE